ncbi:MAG: site-specific integrase [Nitrospira sp.]|jgi:site-specific recombinase XerD|nr:site-specific integrase [Nitrospira sp.]
MGLVKRGNIWWMNIVFQGQRIRRSTGSSNRALADAIMAKVKVQLIEGQYFERAEEQSRTFAELMDRFEREHLVKLASRQTGNAFVKRFRAFFGERTLGEITPKLIVEYKSLRYAAGVKPASINRELTCLRKAFSLAKREWEWCRDNPVSRVSLEKGVTKRDRWLMEDEEARLLDTCPSWLRELVVFALHSGMRLGEILSLTWTGVDLFRRTATVFESKNGERRTVPLNHTVMALLTEKAKVRHIKTALVFPSLAGTRLDPNHLRRALRPAMAKAGIVNCHFHDLRHTFATRLVQSGVDLYKVQRLLGHKSPMMTQRYAHHYPESLRDGVEILDRRSHRDTKMTTVLRVSESAALEVVEKLVGDTGIEPVASSV